MECYKCGYIHESYATIFAHSDKLFEKFNFCVDEKECAKRSKQSLEKGMNHVLMEKHQTKQSVSEEKIKELKTKVYCVNIKNFSNGIYFYSIKIYNYSEYSLYEELYDKEYIKNVNHLVQ